MKDRDIDMIDIGDTIELSAPWSRTVQYMGKHPNGYGYLFQQHDGLSVWFLKSELRKYGAVQGGCK